MKTPDRLAPALAACFLLAVSGRAFEAIACAQTPADPKADENAKALLCYLSENKYISGQTDMADANRVKDLTGRYPAIVAFDFYGYTDGNAGANAQNTQAAIDFAKKQKGIVAFQWHWKAPIPGNRGEYYTGWDYPSALKDPNSQMHKDIDLIAVELKKIADAGVPVLFRPLHECNNNFMWWQTKGTANYKALWKLLFEKFTAAGVHNLVWNFNGMASDQGTAMGDWYPGDNMVDVISSDYYQSLSDYNYMKTIGANKVLGVAETWFALDPSKDPPFSHSVVWASRDWKDPKHGGVVAVENAWKTAMANKKTISVDQVDLNSASGKPRILVVPRDVRYSNTLSSVAGMVDLTKIFQDTSRLAYGVTTAGSTAVSAKINGTMVDLFLKAGDTGLCSITLTATNSSKLSSSVSFQVYLKDYHLGNLALHQPAKASSNDAYAGGALAAFDGDPASRWSSGYTDNEWLLVDLDSALMVDSVTIQWEDAYASGYKIETSLDSILWIPVFTQIAGAGGFESVSFPAVKARFVRMYGTSRATKYGYSLFEMQVFGPGRMAGISDAIRGRSGFLILGTHGRAQLEVRASGAFELSLRDASGRLVLSERGSGSRILPCASLQPGVYHAVLRDAAGVFADRVLVAP